MELAAGKTTGSRRLINHARLWRHAYEVPARSAEQYDSGLD
jgi:hypothetical protein